ncbi:MAG: hypothetical protein ACOH2F_14575 [Cellulomonas sp.]
MAMLKERRPSTVGPFPPRLDQPPVVGGSQVLARARLFAGLEALIMVKELARMRVVWDVSDDDRRFRLQGLERSARRAGQLAECARLAQVRRRSLARLRGVVLFAGVTAR